MVVNKPKVAPYRAPLGPPAGFAGETLIDELAEKLSMDPIEFRLLNAAKEGTRRVSGIPFKKVGYVETLQAAKEHPHYNTPMDGPNRGRGVATAVCNNITGPASAVVILNQDGSVGLVEGSPDLAGSRTAAAMHVAEVVRHPARRGPPPQWAIPTPSDTPPSAPVAASFTRPAGRHSKRPGICCGNWKQERR